MMTRHRSTVTVDRIYAAAIGDPHKQFWCCDAGVESGGDMPRLNKKYLPPREKLIMLILEADEPMMDRILDALETVCRNDCSIPQ